MNNEEITVRLSLMLLLIFHIVNGQERTEVNLENGWKFQKGTNELAFQKEFNDKNWETVSVPQDWAIYGVLRTLICTKQFPNCTKEVN